MVDWGMDGGGTGTIYVRVTFLPWAFSFLSLWTSPPAVFLPLLSLRLLVPFTCLACPFCISVLQDSALWLKWREVKVAQLCPALCNPMDCPWNSPGQNTWVGSLSLLQGIFPTQVSNPGLPHCRLRWSLPAEPQGKPALWSIMFLFCIRSLAISSTFTATTTICVLLTCSMPSPAQTLLWVYQFWYRAVHFPGPPSCGTLLTGMQDPHL